MYKTDRSRRAFSLVEILFAVIIIGVLTAVAIPSLFSQKGKADDSNAKQTLRAALTLIQSSADESNQLQDTTGPLASPNASGLKDFLLTQDKNFKWNAAGPSTKDGNVRVLSIAMPSTAEIVKLAAIGGKNSTGGYNCFGISFDVSGLYPTVYSKKSVTNQLTDCTASATQTPDGSGAAPAYGLTGTTEKTGDFPLK